MGQRQNCTRTQDGCGRFAFLEPRHAHFAFALNPAAWRFGVCTMTDARGKALVRWYCFGALSVTWD